MEFWYRGQLRFRDRAAIDAARAALVDEGCAGHEDNLIGDDDLRWNGTLLEIDMRGSMPYACFEISTFALSVYAQHAETGEVIALNVEDGVGERLCAGGEQAELDEDTVEALRRQYGWQSD